MLPLQWFSVLVEWIEILFIAMHPSSSYYCIPIFSPTMIGWKLHFGLSFWWIVSFLHSFIFPLCQTLLLQPMVATISIFTSVLIVAYFSYGHYFSLLCIGHSFIIFLFISFIVDYMGWNIHFCVVWIGYLPIMSVIFFDVYYYVQLTEQPGIICTFISYYLHSHCLWQQQFTSFYRRFGLWGMDPLWRSFTGWICSTMRYAMYPHVFLQ